MLRALLNQALLPLAAAVAARSALIPPEEIDVLVLAVTVAVSLAGSGRTAEGYTCLLAAQRRAEQAQAAGHPWADELALRYGEALDTYAGRYQIARE